MSINDFIGYVSQHSQWLLFFFLSLPVLTFLLSLIYKRRTARHLGDFIFSILIYLASIPGMVSSTLIFYALFFLRQNMLNVDIILYYLPIFSMLSVFIIIKRKTDFDRLPGFGRLWGLMVMLMLVCLCLLFLYRVRFFVGFFGSLESLIGIAVVIFILFKLAARKMRGKPMPPIL